MIVLDASVLIAHADEGDAHHVRAVDVLDEVDDGLDASPVTLAEVLVRPVRDGILPRAQAYLEGLGVEAIGLEADAPVRLAVLQAETGLRLPDCCVLLAAQQAGGVVLTFDDRLRRIADGLGLAVGPSA